MHFVDSNFDPSKTVIIMYLRRTRTILKVPMLKFWVFGLMYYNCSGKMLFISTILLMLLRLDLDWLDRRGKSGHSTNGRLRFLPTEWSHPSYPDSCIVLQNYSLATSQPCNFKGN